MHLARVVFICTKNHQHIHAVVAAVGLECMFILPDSCSAVCVHYDPCDNREYSLVDIVFQVGTCCDYQGKIVFLCNLVC